MEKYGLIGQGIGKSLSPFIHSRFFDYNYGLFELEENEVEKKLKERDFDGLNVTIPFKKTVMPYLDFIDKKAEEIGSVNTIVNKNGALYGYNTDYFGFIKTLEKVGFDAKNKKALVLGSGGASLSIRQALVDLGSSEVITVSRSGENNYSNLSRHSDASIIVNTTPVGKYPNNGEKPLSLNGFKRLEAVIDINYNPIKSALLIEAQKNNISVSGGLTMLVFQAKKSAELFTGKAVENEKAEAVEDEIIKKMKNIVFIGMPSCGKSTVGKIVAKRLDRAFFDTDEMVKKTNALSPSEIIVKSGEKVFRNMETDEVLKAAKETGAVISVGGGAVLKEENVDALKQNGILVYLDRPLDELISSDRPLSKDIPKLFGERKQFYEKAADIKIKSLETAEETAKAVIEKLF